MGSNRGEVIGFPPILSNSYSSTMGLGFTQLLTVTNIRNLSGGGKGKHSDCLENVESSTSRNLIGLHNMLLGWPFFYLSNALS
jgi:hypothetical protein